MMGNPFDQSDYAARFDWGVHGIERISDGLDVIVVIDVLSFTTAVSVATSRGAHVYPYRWRDDAARTYAMERSAKLADGRDTATLSLSPVSMQMLKSGDRVVLPSPNGAMCVLAAREHGAEVIAGCLRNATAVSRWLQARLDAGANVGVIAAGEVWTDESLRPSFEDLVGSGAILHGLDSSRMSPEVNAAIGAYRFGMERISELIHGCASGRELIERGFAEDVALAAQVDADEHVPVLRGESFVNV